MPEQFPSPEQIAKTESIMTEEEKELSEIRELTSQDRGEFSIVSPKETDSLQTDSWKSYLDRKKLLGAWLPPQESPYTKFIKTKTINSVEFIGSKIKPRYSGGEIKSEQELDNLINGGQLEQGTAVILDSGGAHSVAMAAKLAERGFQPVVMFDSTPHSKGLNHSEQELATLLYFAEQMNKLKQEGKIKPDAPPVFILDTHRDGMDVSLGKDKTIVKNTYTYSESDFPSPEELQKLGIKKLIYLNEGDQRGEIRPDFQSTDRLAKDVKPIVAKWTQAGIKIVYTGISPWEHHGNDFRFSRFHDDF
ncbi:MAG: hypothetical protein AAB861_01095 [Patescibacteria group bacterium]